MKDINDLLALETYEGMTDEEVSAVIEYRAEVKARDTKYEEMLQYQQEMMQGVSKMHAEAAQMCKMSLNSLVGDALERLKSES